MEKTKKNGRGVVRGNVVSGPEGGSYGFIDETFDAVFAERLVLRNCAHDGKHSFFYFLRLQGIPESIGPKNNVM